MEPDVADKRFIFRIDHPELLSELQLEKVGVDKSGLRFYTFEQMRPFVVSLHKKGRIIGNKPKSTRTSYERAALKLVHALELYIQLRYSLQPNLLALADSNTTPSGIANYAADLEGMREASKALKDYISALKLKWPEEKPWPHMYTALEWHAKAGSDLEDWQKDGQFFQRADFDQENASLGREAGVLGQFFYELRRSGEVSPEDLVPANETNLGLKVKSSLQLLAERNKGKAGFARFAHEIQDYLSLDEAAQGKVARYLLLVEGPMQVMEMRANLLMIPPDNQYGYANGWMKTAAATLHGVGALVEVPQSVRLYGQMSSAFDARHKGETKGDPRAFNRAVVDYNVWLVEKGFSPEVKKGREEHFFNTFAPFARAQGIYVIALLLACFSWLKMSRGLINTAFYLIGLAFVLHTSGLIFRMLLEGRPPVTNLYSSAVFCGWGAVLLGWILERIYRNGIGSCVAALVGFSTLIIASHYAKDGDTMEMLVAVLDTNLWLATHVVCITIGYSATFLAGFLGIVYVLRGVFTSSLESETAKGLARMVYGIICFATLFSFVGTVLGGIWADQSWGRFWGWDPKENGALLIVVWNVIILHCRWGGFVKDRGLMGLAIFGNIVTAWSWFGVNMLGSGLHSYGFTEGAFHSLKWFAIGQILLMIAGAQPLSHWLSARHLAKEQSRLVGSIVAALMGLGIVLHVTSFWGSGLLSYVGIALVCAGLVLSYLPDHITGTSAKKAT